MNKRYLNGEPCNLVHIEDIDTTWGEEIDKDKGSKFTFKCKQSAPTYICGFLTQKIPLSDKNIQVINKMGECMDRH